MRKILLATMLIALGGALAASAAAPTASVAPEVPDVDGVSVAPETTMCSEESAAADDTAALFVQIGVPCTNGSPLCRRDSDCASFCGDPQLGVCRDRCCVCTG
jgi:hypothetical protein